VANFVTYQLNFGTFEPAWFVSTCMLSHAQNLDITLRVCQWRETMICLYKNYPVTCAAHPLSRTSR